MGLDRIAAAHWRKTLRWIFFPKGKSNRITTGPAEILLLVMTSSLTWDLQELYKDKFENFMSMFPSNKQSGEGQEKEEEGKRCRRFYR